VQSVSRLGVFGGTFDPPHIGHFGAAGALVEVLELDRLLLVPAFRSPLKNSDPTAAGPLRKKMLEAVVAGDERLEVSDVELRREGPSFTVDTLTEIAAGNTGARLVLAMGVDQWAEFGRWHRPRDIARLAELAVMTRSGERPREIDPGLSDGLPLAFTEVAVPRIDVSSSEVRRRIQEGRSVRYLVPEAVRRIVETEKLYL
jgi:nicotinate-nucleotide adenylyltransferase